MRRRERVLGACVLVLGAVACGDNLTPPPAPWRSGTRLRAEVADGGDGAVLFRAWRDTALGVDCAFGAARDGVMRCLPAERAYRVFADAACTDSVVAALAPSGCAAPRFALEVEPGDGCDVGRTSVYEVGAPRGVQSVYIPDGVGRCAPFPFPLAFSIYELGRAVAPDELVAATVASVARPAGVIAHVATAADGASQVLGLAHADGTACGRFAFPDGGSACIAGVATPWSNAYADDACTQVAPAVASGCASRPDLVDDGAGALFLPGAALSDHVYLGAPDACAPEVGASAWSFGPPAHASDFPPLTTAGLGAGGLRARYAADVDQAPLVAEAMTAAATGTPCQPTRVQGAPPSDPWRCVPLDVPFVQEHPLFSDPACTVPTGPAVVAEVGVTRVVVDAGTSCEFAPMVTHLFAVRSHEGAVYSADGGTCSLLDVAGRLFDLTEELPIGALPAVTIRVE